MISKCLCGHSYDLHSDPSTGSSGCMNCTCRKFQRASGIRKLIYLAGPMALGNMANNIGQAWAAAERLRDAGFTPITPQDNFFGSIVGKRRSHDEWLDIDKPLVLASAAVLRLPGKSKGADMEIAWATEAGIPVYEADDGDALERLIHNLL